MRPVFGEDLDLWFQDCAVEAMVIDGTTSHEPRPRGDGTDSEHQGSAGFTPRVRHCVSGRCSTGLTKRGQIRLAAGESRVGVQGSEISCEHRCRDFSAVGTVTNESVGQTRRDNWLLGQPSLSDCIMHI